MREKKLFCMKNLNLLILKCFLIVLSAFSFIINNLIKLRDQYNSKTD